MMNSQVWLITLVCLLVLTPITSVVAAGVKKEKFNYVSLGDSLAAGQLSDKTLGIGYAGNIAKDLEANGYEVNFSNKGVPGATSTEVVAQLSAQELINADIVTISAGANDLLRALDMSKIALFDKNYLNPEAVAEMKNTVKIEIDTDIEAAIDMAEESIVEAAGKIAALHTTMETLEEAVKPYETLLSDDIKEALTSIRSDLDHVILKLTNIQEAKDSFVMGEESSRETLGTISNELGSISEGINKINNTITTINLEIDKLPITVPVEIVEAVETVKNLSLDIKENVDTAKIMIDDALIKLDEFDERIAVIDRLVVNAQEVQEMLAHLPNKITGAGQNTAQIIAAIKEVNPDVQVYVLEYYNALPYLSAEIQQFIVPLLIALNDANKAVADATGAIYIPTFEAFAGKHEDYLPNPGDIHPNEAGYRVIADAFMSKINESFPEVSKPKPTPEEPKEPNEPEEEPGESDKQPETVEIVLGNSPVEVFAGALVTIKDTQTTIQLPEDLPSGTMLQIMPMQVDIQKGLTQSGEAFDFIFTYPVGEEDYKGEFVLTLGVTGEHEGTSIYHYQTEDQVWELIGGKLEEGKLTATVSHFSMYGVFTLEKTTEPSSKQESSSKEKTVKDDQGTADNKEKENNDKNITDEEVKVEKETQKLPETATNQYNWLIIGILLVLTGGSIEFIRRKSAMMK